MNNNLVVGLEKFLKLKNKQEDFYIVFKNTRFTSKGIKYINPYFAGYELTFKA